MDKFIENIVFVILSIAIMITLKILLFDTGILHQ